MISLNGPSKPEKLEFKDWFMQLSEAVYLGCFEDRERNRALPDLYIQKPWEMTVEYCFQFCWENDMRYAGMTEGNICMCGGENTDYAKYGAAMGQCSKTCDGYRYAYWSSSSRDCGGESTTSIYDLRSKYHFNLNLFPNDLFSPNNLKENKLKNITRCNDQN